MEEDLEERLKANKHAFFQRVQTEKFLSLLDKKYTSALEVGCGRGFWSYVGFKYKKFKKISGCDKNNFLQIGSFKKIQNNILPYRSNTFDVVFSMDVVEHVEDDLKFITEKIRVCKKGGDIIIGTPNLNRITNLLLKFFGRLNFPRNLGKDYYGDCIHKREYSIKSLEGIIAKAGGRDIKIYPCWMGILALNLGIEKVPKMLSNNCHFIFAKFKKL